MDKQDLRIVFMGNPDFAVGSLRRIHQGGYNIVGVVTMPDKTGGRGNKVIESAVKRYATEAGLPCIMQPEKLKDPEFVDRLRSLDADLFIVIAFRMLPEVVWAMPRLGTFNLHASLLPKYRGAAPLNWAVINGDSQTGVTTFFLKHEIDTGDIIRREAIDIGEDENVGSVHDRLMELGAELTVDTIDHIIAGDLKPIPQSEMEGGNTPTPAPKIFKDTCRINWGRTAAEVHNLVRGLSPYPAAWTKLAADGAQAADVKILATRRTGLPACCPPGTVKTDQGQLLAATADSWLEVLEIQPAGKRRMTAGEYLRGVRAESLMFE